MYPVTYTLHPASLPPCSKLIMHLTKSGESKVTVYGFLCAITQDTGEEAVIYPACTTLTNTARGKDILQMLSPHKKTETEAILCCSSPVRRMTVSVPGLYKYMSQSKSVINSPPAPSANRLVRSGF